ncbi:hypothetical protein EYF80_015713 [Liparis tanakae]|uniref:Uncharacterized protein n=1 Tax=Liparis tanakae TaxID=230148 RepID=A0A4Z2I9J6_9TELE|nr:hypothetical protein EYF80_015713 [Liparis tanakae]
MMMLSFSLNELQARRQSLTGSRTIGQRAQSSTLKHIQSKLWNKTNSPPLRPPLPPLAHIQPAAGSTVPVVNGIQPTATCGVMSSLTIKGERITPTLCSAHSGIELPTEASFLTPPSPRREELRQSSVRFHSHAAAHVAFQDSSSMVQTDKWVECRDALLLLYWQQTKGDEPASLETKLHPEMQEKNIYHLIQLVHALVKPLADYSTRRLDVIGGGGAELVQSQLLLDVRHRKGFGQVLLVGDDQQRRALVLRELGDFVQFRLGLLEPVDVHRVHDVDDPIGAPAVGLPQGPQLLLAPDVPEVTTDALRCAVAQLDLLGVEPDGGNRVDELVEFESVEDRGLPGGVQAQHDDDQTHPLEAAHEYIHLTRLVTAPCSRGRTGQAARETERHEDRQSRQ